MSRHVPRTPFVRPSSFPLILPLLLAAILLLPVSAGADDAVATHPPEHEETRSLMALVEDAVDEVEAQGVEAACETFHQADSRWFHDEVYVFVNDLEGRSLCHPAKPSLEGRSVLDLRDPHGKPIVQSFQRETEDDGEGWVHYLWPRPGAGTNFHWKTSYVRRAEAPDAGEVIVGSGLYQVPMERMFVVEQVQDAAELLVEKGSAAFPQLRDKASGFRFYDSYLFVMTTDGVQLVNAGFPENEGENLLDLADENGKVIGREMLALLEQQDSGWVDYAWPRPGDRPASTKSTYVRKVEMPDGRVVVVGAGIYRD